MKNQALNLRISERRLNKLRLYSSQNDKTMTHVIEDFIYSLWVWKMAIPHRPTGEVNPTDWIGCGSIRHSLKIHLIASRRVGERLLFVSAKGWFPETRFCKNTVSGGAAQPRNRGAFRYKLSSPFFKFAHLGCSRIMASRLGPKSTSNGKWLT
jgi:hypothetical protein